MPRYIHGSRVTTLLNSFSPCFFPLCVMVQRSFVCRRHFDTPSPTDPPLRCFFSFLFRFCLRRCHTRASWSCGGATLPQPLTIHDDFSRSKSDRIFKTALGVETSPRKSNCSAVQKMKLAKSEARAMNSQVVYSWFARNVRNEWR